MRGATSALDATRYPSGIVTLHWLSFGLVAAAYALVELKSFAPRGSELRLAMLRFHYVAGFLVFAFAWLRLALRAIAEVPPVTPPPPRWMRAAARSFLFALYALLVAAPLLGWLALSARAQPVDLGFFELPLLPNLEPSLARPMRAWHARIANAGYVLIGIHVGAALFHHYVLRDDALERMTLLRNKERLNA